MVTKRTIMGIQERVRSASDRLSGYPNQLIPHSVVTEIIDRDLSQALTDLEYAFSVAD